MLIDNYGQQVTDPPNFGPSTASQGREIVLVEVETSENDRFRNDNYKIYSNGFLIHKTSIISVVGNFCRANNVFPVFTKPLNLTDYKFFINYFGDLNVSR